MAVALAFFTSLLLLLCFRRVAIRWGFVDRPNARSAHRSPTPVGAGICFALAVILALFVPNAATIESPFVLMVLQAGGLLVALVGLIDDRHILPVWLRLFVYLASSTVAAVVLLDAAPLLIIGLVILALGWTINLVNFMDGLDGFVVTQALCVCFGLGVISLFIPGASGVSHFTLVLAGALVPFLWRNWPPARFFMGDSGAVFLGFYLGSVGLYAAGQDSRLGAVWLVLMMPFIVDATATLFIRLMQGKSLAQAHSEHTYQRLKRASGSALAINGGLLALQVLWQIPVAIWGTFGSYSPVFAVIFATIPSLVLVAYGRRYS
ncbi:MAG: glycosyltransferase family 4 protein [Luminiphilus sp.]|nr:glycosyltransferase family 4 protein [Luminiphilus sp.]